MFAVSERAVDACSNFLFIILDMTATISVRPGPPDRDFEHEGTILKGKPGGVSDTVSRKGLPSRLTMGEGDLQPDCSADWPVTGPRQPT
eukprot:1136432-Pelagomonas_calceolata.AAC.1